MDPGINVTKLFFPSPLTMVQSKLERISFTRLFFLVFKSLPEWRNFLLTSQMLNLPGKTCKEQEINLFCSKVGD
jgi:hypothetical protein